MEHLSQQQMSMLIDSQLDDAEERLVKTHLLSCARCTAEVTLQRSLVRAARELPLERTSQRFTERLMSRVIHSSKPAFSYKLLQNLGSAFAMIAVLVVLGYVLSSPPALLSGASDSPSSELFTAWKTFYTNVYAFLTQSTTQLNQTVTQQTAAPISKILVTTFLVLVGFFALDRFVLQKIVRTKM